MKKRIFYPILLPLVLISLMLNSCEKRSENSYPQLPPLSSFYIDFSEFGSPADTLSTRKLMTDYYNWGAAISNVAFWNTVITVGMVLPAAVYAEALKQKPVYLGDDRWEWMYNFDFNSVSYLVRLKTQNISDEQYLAELYVSNTGPGSFYDFKWFEGIVNHDLSKASWILYDNPFNADDQLLSIDWNSDPGNNSGDITFTIIKENHQEKGSYVSYAYSANNSLRYNSSYSILLSSNQVLIEWNSKTRAGRIKNPEWFKDDSWHCWNENLQNDFCVD